LTKITLQGEQIAIVSHVTACRDAKDNKFLDVAVNGQATVLVSGDDDLLERVADAAAIEASNGSGVRRRRSLYAASISEYPNNETAGFPPTVSESAIIVIAYSL
jgi:hypothetical protein